MAGRRVKRLAPALGAVAVALAALLGWRFHRASVEQAPPSSAAAPAATKGAASGASAAAPPRPMQAVSPLPARASAAALPGTVEVCGYGRVAREDLDRREGQPPPAWARALDARYEAERQALLRRLDGGTPRQRVAAAVLREDVSAAATQAASSDDAVAYLIALRACRRNLAYLAGYAAQQAWLRTPAASGVAMPPEMRPPSPVPDSCAALSVERLQALAPGDATPVLMRLSDHLARGEAAGVAQDLYQLSQGGYRPLKTRVLSATVGEVVGADPSPSEAMMLMVAAGQDAVSIGDSGLSGLMAPCSVGAVQDANRRQLCEAVVRQLPSTTAEVMEARILHRLEEGLGLPHSPQAVSRDEANRLLQLMAEQGMAWAAELSCANFSRSGRQVLALARDGELAYLHSLGASAPR